jgi:protein-tyrosine phosphatase
MNWQFGQMAISVYKIPMKFILVVCTANICRSPMVAGILRARFAAIGLEDEVIVRSAGVYAHEGEPATNYGVELLAAKGIDISGHRATQVVEWDIGRANLILVMEEAHRRKLFYYSPGDLYKVILFSELIGEHDDLEDPYGQDTLAYVTTLARIEHIINTGWEKLLGNLKIKPPAGG